MKKIIFSSKDHKIYNGKCLDFIDHIEDKSCKLLFADPPYNMGKNFGNNKDKWETIEAYKNWSIAMPSSICAIAAKSVIAPSDP